MSDEPFFERFRRILSERSLSFEDAASTMGTSVDVIRRLADGRTKQAKFDEALKLCDRLGVDPWYLAFGRSRPTPALPDESLAGADVVETLRGEIREIQSAVAATQRVEAETRRRIEALTTLIEGLIRPQS